MDPNLYKQYEYVGRLSASALNTLSKQIAEKPFDFASTLKDAVAYEVERRGLLKKRQIELQNLAAGYTYLASNPVSVPSWGSPEALADAAVKLSRLQSKIETLEEMLMR